MEGGFLLDVVVRESTSILELLSSEDESLLVGRDALLILDLGLNVVDRVRGLHLKSDGLASESLDEDLHTTTKSEYEMESRFFLNVIVGEGSTVFELLSSEDESLLVRRDALLVLDLSLHVIDGVRRLDLESDSLTGEGLDEDLHTTAKSEDEMKSGFLLDVIIREGSSIFELLTGEDKTLLIGRNTFLVLDLGFHVVNGVRWLNLECDGLTSESFDENLHVYWLTFAF